jgi:hypothetical protein
MLSLERFPDFKNDFYDELQPFEMGGIASKQEKYRLEH